MPRINSYEMILSFGVRVLSRIQELNFGISIHAQPPPPNQNIVSRMERHEFQPQCIPRRNIPGIWCWLSPGAPTKDTLIKSLHANLHSSVGIKIASRGCRWTLASTWPWSVNRVRKNNKLFAFKSENLNLKYSKRFQ